MTLNFCVEVGKQHLIKRLFF